MIVGPETAFLLQPAKLEAGAVLCHVRKKVRLRQGLLARRNARDRCVKIELADVNSGLSAEEHLMAGMNRLLGKHTRIAADDERERVCYQCAEQ